MSTATTTPTTISTTTPTTGPTTPPATRFAPPLGGLPADVQAFLDAAITCEYATLTGSGRPVTWPVTPYRGEDGTTLDVSTGVTYPSKAERARRDPRVSLLCSDPVGSGMRGAPVVLVQGLATVRDGDLQAGLDRYVRVQTAKLPGATAGTPWFLLRRQAWYFARIWVHVTPLRVTWWEGGDLSVAPRTWTAPESTSAPPSDPAPAGAAPAAWRPVPGDWRPAADRAERLGAPVLTLTDAAGWPLPLRSRAAERVDDGFVVTLPAGAPALAHPGQGPRGGACLTFHTHEERFTGQENVGLVGTATPVDGGERVHVAVERALSDWSLAGGRWARARSFMTAGRTLTRRLAEEAARRGQPVPAVHGPRPRA